MNERIAKLTEKTVKGEMYVYGRKCEYDRLDLLLSPIERSGKRVCEFIRVQEPFLTEDNCFTGSLNLEAAEVEGTIFQKTGCPHFAALMRDFYNKPVDGLTTFEWQHSVADFSRVIRRGLRGFLADIAKAEEKHAGDPERLAFLHTQTEFCNAVIAWAHKCADRADALAATVVAPDRRENLLRLGTALLRVPEYPAESFYEAMLSLYLCFSFVPDSVGLLDRYLYPYYEKDIREGRLTEEEAKAYLQELFLMLQAHTHKNSPHFYRGGESHFCIGGYLPNGEDGFNPLSRLILTSLIELPTWIPQVSLRFTEKTPHEVLHFAMEQERKDPNKRIAFVNDEPRIRGLMQYSGLSYEEAVGYSMCGCNEPTVPGGMVLGIDTSNVARSMANLFQNRGEALCAAPDFDAFYALYQKELFSELDEMEKIAEGFQRVRARDVNIVSNLFFEGCIEEGKCMTQGGLSKYCAVATLIGITTVIDSLAVVDWLVYTEKRVPMSTLVAAVQANWEGYGDLRDSIRASAPYFGNDDPISNGVARRFFASLAEWNRHENYLGRPYIFGNLIGYNEHNKFFGDLTAATPDGRARGDRIAFGIGQGEGRDRNGLTALLSSVAKCDPEHVLVGPSVTNVLLDERLVNEDASFEKLVRLFETYFRMGGTHFQLTYVSRKDLLAAKATPDRYKSLRVRVSGFSDYFVRLNEALQDEIIDRTQHAG